MNASSANTTQDDLKKRAARIKLLLMDVDGVLTDGRLIYLPAPDGSIFETKAFDSQDGIALQWLSWHGIATGVISGRESPATAERARQVKMSYVYQGHIEKTPILEEIFAKSGATPEETAYAGDDLTDVVVMRHCHCQRAARGQARGPLRHYGGRRTGRHSRSR
jgi:3-deoxy-D-manno-octulosonate 8-phosphate phosphatase (KDO 8-P phosphatase)